MLITGFLLVNVLWMGMELQINGQMNGSLVLSSAIPQRWLAFLRPPVETIQIEVFIGKTPNHL